MSSVDTNDIGNMQEVEINLLTLFYLEDMN